MNTRRAAVRRSEEDLANSGALDDLAPPQDKHVLPLEQVPVGDKVSVIPPPMTDGKIRADFLDLA